MISPAEVASRICASIRDGLSSAGGKVALTGVEQQVAAAIAQARADGYFERYDNPMASPSDAASELGCTKEMVAGIYARTK